MPNKYLNPTGLIFLFFILSSNIYSDSFIYNTYNNHGSVGLVNMPTARFYNESSFGITFFDGEPDQKLTFSSNPYDWLEASFFYTNLKDIELCRNDGNGNVSCQGYKDKGFNFKIKIKDEGRFPAIAIGINDIAGTGFYSSEYVVASYGINMFDFHFGLGWGQYNGSKYSFKNFLGGLNDSFYDRPDSNSKYGGQLEPSKYFSGENTSPFFGVSYAVNKNLVLKVENDTTVTPGLVGYMNSNKDVSLGIDYSINKNFTLGLSLERDDYISLRLSYKKQGFDQRYEYKKAKMVQDRNKTYRLRKNLQNNGIGVNKIYENKDSIGIEISQFVHPSLDIIEEIIQSAVIDSEIDKDIKKNITIVDLNGLNEFDDEFERNSNLIYKKPESKGFKTKTSLRFRPFIASREEFFKGSILIENNSEYLFSKNFTFSSNLKYSLVDNFDDLTIPPENTYPAQVRSDVKDYLRNFSSGIFIGRAQFDYFYSVNNSNHIMLTAGILEEMFSGYGFEYLWSKPYTNYAVGFEVFDVTKRDYQMRLNHLDYDNVSSHVNFYYRNYGKLPFDAKFSFGEYLAGDQGASLEFSRSFKNGTEFGVFFSKTNVSTEEFGEGSFDKGIFFNVPVFGNFINYSWRPLTKDPGQKLIRKNNLYDLLVRFKPIN